MRAIIALGLFAVSAAGQSGELLKALESPVAAERMIAAEKLGRQQSQAAIPALIAALDDAEESVQSAAIRSLLRIGSPTFAPVAAALSGKSDAVQVRALILLKFLAPKAAKLDVAPATVEALATAAELKNPEARINAIEALGALGPKAKAALPRLMKAATDATPLNDHFLRGHGANGVAEAAVAAILAIDPDRKAKLAETVVPAMTKALTKAIEDNREGWATVAVAALKLLGESAKAAEPDLKAALDAINHRSGLALRIQAALDSIRGQAATATLIGQLKAGKLSPREKAEALERLAAAKDLAASPELAGLLADLSTHENVKVKAGAVRVMGPLAAKSKEVRAAMLERLGDSDLIEEANTEGGTAANVPLILAKCPEVVAELTAIVADESASTLRRSEAALTLGKMGRKAESAKSKLLAASTGKPPLGMEATYAFLLVGGDSADARELLKASLHSDRSTVRTQALIVLVGYPPLREAFVDRIVKLVDDEEREVRIYAARLAALLGEKGKAAIPAIAKHLAAKDARERYQMCEAVYAFGPLAAEAAPALIAQLDALDLTNPNPTLAALGKLGRAGKASGPKLIQFVKSADAQRQFLVPQALETLGLVHAEPKDTLPVLFKALASDKKDQDRIEPALKSIGRYGDEAKAAFEPVRKLLVHPEHRIRVWAHAALVKLGEPAAEHVAEIVELAKDEAALELPFNTMDFFAAEALAYIGPEASPARDWLLEVAAGPKTSAAARHQALEALRTMKMDAKTIAGKLGPLLKIKDDAAEGIDNTNLELICELLAEYGPDAKPAEANLKAMLEHPEPRVAWAAKKALAAIQ